MEPSGSVRIGTVDNPATNVTLYLDHADCEDDVADSREENWNGAATECLKRGEVLIRGDCRTSKARPGGSELLSTAWCGAVCEMPYMLTA